MSSPVELDPTVQVALVGVVGTLGAALIAGMVTIITLLIQTKRHAARADWQATNNHVDANGQPINQREEISANHAESMEAIESVAGTVRGLQRDFGRMDTRLVGLRQEFTELSGRVVLVENTQQKEEIERVRDSIRNRT